MNNSTVYNNAGKTLIVDKVIEKKGKVKQSKNEKDQYLSSACLQANYSKLKNQVLQYVSDDYLTSAEKQQLRKEIYNIDSTYSSLFKKSQDLEFNNDNSIYYQIYLNFTNSYQNLKTFINPFLASNVAESINGTLLTQKVQSYYLSVSKLEESIFIVMYGATTRIDIEFTTQFFVFNEDNLPVPTTQTITANIIAWGATDSIIVYVNNIQRTILNNEITISLDDISGRDEVTIRLVSGEQELVKKIGKVFNGKSNYEVQIYSSNGNAFHTGKANTTLSAYVFRGSKDVTDQIDENRFSWKRVSQAGSIADNIWSTSAKAFGKKSVHITPVDSIGRTVFSCDVLIEE